MNEIEIQVVDFKNHFTDIEKIRTDVFINEQNVPIELEWDEFDDDSTHVLAYYNNKPVGTARLLNDGRIGRMAVLADYRHRNIGTKILKFLLEIAQKDSNNKIRLSAQEHAIGFYIKHGFKITSEVYMDAGIPHYDMEYTG